MPSIFESEKLEKSAMPLRAAAQQLSLLFPDLEWDLKRAGYPVSAVQYLATAMFITIVVFIITLFSISTALIIRKEFAMSYSSIVVSIVISTIAFLYVMMIPKLKIVSKGRLIDKDLEYMLKDMRIQLTSGIPLFDTLVNIAKGGYGECSKVANNIVQEVQAGRPITKVLEDYGLLSPSEYLRRVLWQIVNAVKTGSDITLTLKAISSDIRVEKENRIKIYEQELNLWSLIYMMGIIVMPSMGITLLVILSSFMGGATINENLFWAMLIALIMFQIAFISIVRSKRPNID